MGEDYSHAHAACLAAQLPAGARCLAKDSPRNAWSKETWMLWRIEHDINLLRWAFVKRWESEPAPDALPYPGKAEDDRRSEERYTRNKSMVEAAFDMGGGE